MKTTSLIVSPLFVALLMPFCASAQQTLPSSVPVYEELQKVVVISRHGVRSPTQSAKTLDTWSPKQWPQWPVQRGFLTPRGFDLIKQTWEMNAKSGPFVHSYCPADGEVEVIADVDERTIRTAQALVDGLYPGCNVKIKISKEKHSPLFSPLKAKVCKIKDPEALAQKLTDKAKNVSTKFSKEISLLNEVTEGNFFGEIKGHADKHKVGLSGAPYNGSSFTEILALEWGQWPDSTPGWGKMPWSEIIKAMPLRVGVFTILNRDMEVARYKGSALAQKILDSLVSQDGPKYTFLIGHDTNIANLGALFDLNWKQPDRCANENVPGGYLKFEKWLVGNKPEIRVSYSALSPDQIHLPQITKPAVETEVIKKGVNFDDWVNKYKNRIYSKCVPVD